MRLEGGLVFVQSILTILEYYLFWVVRVGRRVGKGDSISRFIDKQHKCFVLEMLFILWVVIIFVDKCLYNMFNVTFT